MGTRKAVAVGYAFAIVDEDEVRVRVDGVEYPLMKAGTHAGSRSMRPSA